MLSATTLNLLQVLQDKSHETFDQGGVLYTYMEAANQAHSLFPGGEASVESELNIESLACFLQVTQQGHPVDNIDAASRPEPSFAQSARTLISSLRSDLAFDEASLKLEGDDAMQATISMARRKDNRFFSLELWWSMD